MVARHVPAIRAPFYADAGDGTLLHRYFETDFVTRHVQRLQANELQGNRAQSWRDEDRFADDKTLTWLRLPVHRTFYMVSAEVACDTFGFPAFDPTRIVSAGFVVRRRDGARWIQTNGIEQGWVVGRDDDDDPDLYRRIVNHRLIRPKPTEPLPTGEVHYPLHAQLIDVAQADGRRRKHTLLYGYLPLSGSVAAGTVETHPPGDYVVDTLPWPMGLADVDSRQLPVWQTSHGRLMTDGRAAPSLNALVNALVGRFRVGESGVAANQALLDWADRIHFYRLPDRNRYSQTRQRLQAVADLCQQLPASLALLPQGMTADAIAQLAALKATMPALAYPTFETRNALSTNALLSVIAPIQAWLHRVESLRQTLAAAQPAALPVLMALDAAQAVADSSTHTLKAYLSEPANFRLQSLKTYLVAQHDALAAKVRIDGDVDDVLTGVGSDWQLYLTAAEAEQLRGLLFDRAVAEVKPIVDSLHMPRYQQRTDDVYFIRPFVRYLNEQGCEHVVWGPNSEPFRVASTYEPDACRPQTIPLPKFSDLKRGLANGARFVAPKDLADKLFKISTDMPPEEKSGSGMGLEWIISFSLPIITVCAMMLLMIIINLLNLFLQWLPFAITLIPKPTFTSGSRSP